jgi:hypothetical protein
MEISPRTIDTLKNGGKLVVHTQTFAEIKRDADPPTWLLIVMAEAEGRVVPNDLVELGIVYAVERGREFVDRRSHWAIPPR